MLFLPSSSSLSRTLRASPPCGRGSVPQVFLTKPLQRLEKEAGPPSLASPGQPRKQCLCRSLLQASRPQQAKLHHLPRRRAQWHPLQMSQSHHHQLRQQLPTAATPLLSQRDRHLASRTPSLPQRSEREGSSLWCRWSAIKALFFEV